MMNFAGNPGFQGDTQMRRTPSDFSEQGDTKRLRLDSNGPGGALGDGLPLGSMGGGMGGMDFHFDLGMDGGMDDPMMHFQDTNGGFLGFGGPQAGGPGHLDMLGLDPLGMGGMGDVGGGGGLGWNSLPLGNPLQPPSPNHSQIQPPSPLAANGNASPSPGGQSGPMRGASSPMSRLTPGMHRYDSGGMGPNPSQGLRPYNHLSPSPMANNTQAPSPPAPSPQPGSDLQRPMMPFDGPQDRRPSPPQNLEPAREFGMPPQRYQDSPHMVGSPRHSPDPRMSNRPGPGMDGGQYPSPHSQSFRNNVPRPREPPGWGQSMGSPRGGNLGGSKDYYDGPFGPMYDHPPFAVPRPQVEVCSPGGGFDEPPPRHMAPPQRSPHRSPMGSPNPMAFAQPGGGLSPRPNIKGEAPAWNPNTGGVPKRKPPPSGHFAVGRPAVEEAESAGSGGDDYVSPAPMQQQKKKPGPKPKPKAPVDAVAAAPLPAPAVLAIRAPRPPPPPTSKGPDDDFQLDYIRDSLLPALVKHTSAAPFREPVDPVALNIPHYPAIITHPMDLGTVEKKLRDGEYLTGLQCLYDIMLVFNNCRTFNPAGDPILLTCHRLEQHFNALLKRMPVSPPPSKIRFEKQFCPHCGDLRSQSSFKQHRTLFYRENGYWERHPVEL